jgi:selenocysteine lyase/cysteine desulfurase
MARTQLSDYRSLFPVTEELIYLNHAGVAPISLRVKEAVESFLEQSARWGILGIEKLVRRGEAVRRTIATCLGADSDEIAFVRSTSHGLALVAEGIDWQVGDNVITASCEFPANVYPWMNLARRGVETRLVTPKDGEIRIDDVRASMNARTRLVSLSWVEYQDGFRNDLAALGSLCRERDVLFCVDGIQGVGGLPLDLSRLPVDFLAADGHKWLLAPEGIGFLYLSRRVMDRVHPVIVGWHSVKNALVFEDLDFTLRDDARKFEEGSAPFMGILALGAAFDLLAEVGLARIWRQIRALNDFAAAGLSERGYRVLSPMHDATRSGILTFRSERQTNAALFKRLSEGHIVCAVRGGGIRISPHFYNTEDDIERFLARLP